MVRIGVFDCGRDFAPDGSIGTMRHEPESYGSNLSSGVACTRLF